MFVERQKCEFGTYPTYIMFIGASYRQCAKNRQKCPSNGRMIVNCMIYEHFGPHYWFQLQKRALKSTFVLPVDEYNNFIPVSSPCCMVFTHTNY